MIVSFPGGPVWSALEVALAREDVTRGDSPYRLEDRGDVVALLSEKCGEVILVAIQKPIAIHDAASLMAQALRHANEEIGARFEPAERRIVTPEGAHVPLTEMECRLLAALPENDVAGALAVAAFGRDDDYVRGKLRSAFYRLRQKCAEHGILHFPPARHAIKDDVRRR
ncbi:MAG: hypothetical protein ABW189_06325 [Rickettsiales bacterium]